MKVIVADSSGLIPLDKQFAFSNSKLKKYNIIVPPAVTKELIKDAMNQANLLEKEGDHLYSKRLRDSAKRFQNAIDAGCIQVKQINYIKYSKIIDQVRKHLSALESKSEHELKKADPEIVALTKQLCDDGFQVEVLTLDKNLIKQIKYVTPNIKIITYDVLLD
ncbi:MAG: hypothetical protein ACE5KT_10980 [Methanosarcinales archaeon]